jgi:hypothetical protein
MANAKPVKQAKKQSKTNAAAKSKEDPKKKKKCSDNTATEGPRPSTRSQCEKVEGKPPAGYPSSSSDSDVPEDTTAKPKSLAKKTQNNAKSND